MPSVVLSKDSYQVVIASFMRPKSKTPPRSCCGLAESFVCNGHEGLKKKLRKIRPVHHMQFGWLKSRATRNPYTDVFSKTAPPIQYSGIILVSMVFSK